ncbi:hypothetical protein MLD38_037252 [Melastoma candidum]|uniref:Uncharacterized protein n=1 Tax=Melastoma candidum TaxID=119954 RepID=A0ACB9LMP6_9MYRT|nr:hypothetical protein MLD38_037252 [Melastoma candidum]
MFDGGVCMAVDILKAFDDAIHDGVHVLPLSLGPGQDVFDTEELDGIAVGSLHAVMEGITVVCAAEHSRHPLLLETMKLFGDKPFTLESRSIGFESSTFMPDFLAYEDDSTSDRGCDAEKFRVIAANF